VRLANEDQAAWQRYRELADHPAWFTRWMLSRTRLVLEHYKSAFAEDQAPRDLVLCESALDGITKALQQSPASPPSPVDPRVDMLFVALSTSEARFVAALFETVDDWPVSPPLDAVQQKRKNPWGGFREAWLEHYNHSNG